MAVATLAAPTSPTTSPPPGIARKSLTNCGACSASGGKTTIYIHAYLSNPVSAAVVTTVKVSKIHNGRYGTKSVATIPPIAGEGAVRNFQLELFRTFTYKGKKQSYLLAKCPDGKLQAKAESIFREGSKPLVGTFKRSCTPKG